MPRTPVTRRRPPAVREGYSFSLSRPITLGERTRFTLRVAPSAHILPERVLTITPRNFLKCNFPTLGIMSLVDASDLHAIVAAGPADGVSWRPFGPSRPAVVNCEYEGALPKGATKGSEILLVLTVFGPMARPALRRVK